MFSKKFSSNIRKRKRMITAMVILLVVCLGIGYSAFTTNLGINGTLNVSKYDQTLYGVLEKAVSKGYALEYTGEHHDSFTVEPTKKIYHWWANNDTDGTAIQDKNNVIFANHCWQMIRTTDTGGVKMVYNGEAENNQCLNTRGNHVGYGSSTTTQLLPTYYYGTSYTYDSTNNVFSLDGTITTGTIQTGQYTCKQTTSTGTCGTLYLVDKFSGGTTYYVATLNANSQYSQFGKIAYNQKTELPAYVGYMYNTTFPYNNIYAKHYNIAFSAEATIQDTWYYSTAIDYGNIVSNQYTLINPQLVSDLNDYSNLVGKYILGSGESGSDTGAIYVLSVEENKISFRELRDGDISTSLTIGDSYTESEGIYTLTNPVNISYIDWFTNVSDYNIYKGKYLCDGNNNSCSNLKRICSSRNPSKTGYYYFSSQDAYFYSESISYNNAVYTLTGDIKKIWDVELSTEQELLNNHHYTCFSNETTCTSVNYVYYYYAATISTIKLNGVENVSIALDNMISSDTVNQVNSSIKTGVDAWYKKYMTNYTSQLEDVVFCNDRSINKLGGWDSSNGSIKKQLEFNQSYNSLFCNNETDKFSIANNKAKLTYPVGLLEYPEITLPFNSNINKSGAEYWLISPREFNYYAGVRSVSASGGISGAQSTISFGLRPAISLKPGTEYVSGTGSMADPYIVQ
ncbi:MAG: hypothetical protein IKE63_01675 [Bacilli bacterium]|nr:hypothetical protein [Bacilli bacterium]